jgi:hypothetical protein
MPSVVRPPTARPEVSDVGEMSVEWLEELFTVHSGGEKNSDHIEGGLKSRVLFSVRFVATAK